MEDFIVNLLHVPFVCGVVLLITTAIMRFFPAKTINDFYGYRTEASKKSQQRWDFAQHYSLRPTITASIVLVAIGLSGCILPFPENIKFTIGLLLTPFAAVYIIRTTNRAIEQRFKES